MDFRGFLGNPELKQRLSAGFSKGMISHSYLLCGPSGSGRHTLAIILAAAMECTGEEEVPCGVCRACRKVFAGQHPDVITVDDTEHKNVSVDVIREARADAFIRPNEGKRKVYIIPRGQDLGLPSQNALLKIMEEPPEYGVFLLLTDSAEKLLPTIRSRCAELHLSPVAEAQALPFLRERCPDKPVDAVRAAYLRAGGFLGQALALLQGELLLPQTQQFAACYAARSGLELLQTLLPMEKWKRDQLLPVLAQWKQLLTDALTARSGAPAPSEQSLAICRARTGAELLAAAQALQTAMEYLNANVGVGAIVGWLTIELR